MLRTLMSHLLLSLLVCCAVSISGFCQEESRPTYVPMPHYPEPARYAQVQGDVQVSITVAEDGRVKDVKTLSGPQLLRAEAESSAKEWKFNPTTADGRRTVELLFQFILGKQRLDHVCPRIVFEPPFHIQINSNPPTIQTQTAGPPH